MYIRPLLCFYDAVRDFLFTKVLQNYQSSRKVKKQKIKKKERFEQ